MVDRIRQLLRNKSIEEIYCIFFFVISILLYILTDINETNNLIALCANIILVFITYGIFTIKNEIRNLVKDEGK